MLKMPKVIGFAGPMCSGKDHVASVIQKEYRYN